MTDRKSAEACKRNALTIEKLLDGADPEQPGYADLDAERRACTRTWNDFCAAESQRLAAAKQGIPAAWLL